MKAEFYVHGTPAPQGSKKAFVRGGRALLVDASSKTKPWREAVVSAAIDAGAADLQMDGPLFASCIFWFKRPKSHYRTGKNAHLLRDDAPEYVTTTPDIDKVLRSTYDGLTQAGVIADDRFIVAEITTMRYMREGGFTGAGIYVTQDWEGLLGEVLRLDT